MKNQRSAISLPAPQQQARQAGHQLFRPPDSLKGFTLLELIVAIGLFVFVVVALLGMDRQSMRTAQRVRSIYKAIAATNFALAELEIFGETSDASASAQTQLDKDFLLGEFGRADKLEASAALVASAQEGAAEGEFTADALPESSQFVLHALILEREEQ